MELGKKGKNQIKALIFDVGGVLRLGYPSVDSPHVHEFVAKKLKITMFGSRPAALKVKRNQRLHLFQNWIVLKT